MLGVRGSLTGIDRQGGSRFVQAIIQRFKEVPHGLQGISVEERSHLFPKQAFAAPFGPCRLEQRATQLLHLIHQKRQHHQRGKHHREMLIAMAEIVLEMIALIFQRIERLIFDAPASPRPLHEAVNRAFVDTQIGHPTEMLDFAFGGRLPALDEVDPQVRHWRH